jgi:hypothetical protein
VQGLGRMLARTFGSDQLGPYAEARDKKVFEPLWGFVRATGDEILSTTSGTCREEFEKLTWQCALMFVASHRHWRSALAVPGNASDWARWTDGQREEWLDKVRRKSTALLTAEAKKRKRKKKRRSREGQERGENRTPRVAIVEPRRRSRSRSRGRSHSRQRRFEQSPRRSRERSRGRAKSRGRESRSYERSRVRSRVRSEERTCDRSPDRSRDRSRGRSQERGRERGRSRSRERGRCHSGDDRRDSFYHGGDWRRNDGGRERDRYGERAQEYSRGHSRRRAYWQPRCLVGGRTDHYADNSALYPNHPKARSYDATGSPGRR